MKKQIVSLLCVGALLTGLLAGCGTKDSAGSDAEPESQEQTQQTEQTEQNEQTESLPDLSGHTLMIYCGAGMTEPFEEIAAAFGEQTGCEMNVTYANAGQIQTQITTAEEGDLFIAGAADELKPVESYVTQQKDLVKHIPVLAVQAGNPKEITGLASLAQEGVTLLMGDVESTPIGKIAKKALTDAGIFEQITLAATTTTAPQMSTALAAGEADAAIVWKENCNVEGVEIVDTEDMTPYIKTIPAAMLSCGADSEAAEAFYAYLDTEEVAEIWTSYGYEIAA